MEIIIDGLITSDSATHEEIKNVDDVSIKAIVEKTAIIREGYIKYYLVEYKKGNEIFREKCKNYAEFYFKNNKLLINYGYYGGGDMKARL